VSGRSGTCQAARCSESGQGARGIEISIQHKAADITGESPDSQRQLGFYRATTRARLGRWIPPVGHDQPTPVPGHFISQLPPELAERGIRDRTGESSATYHPSHVEVFDDNYTDRLHEGTGEFVQTVATPSSHAVMNAVALAIGL
jgi:hypothetical protein